MEVPAHLRDAHYAGAAREGWGVEYRYPHSYPGGWVDQQYLPDAAPAAPYFVPSPYGREAALVEQWRRRTNRADQDEPPAKLE